MTRYEKRKEKKSKHPEYKVGQILQRKSYGKDLVMIVKKLEESNVMFPNHYYLAELTAPYSLIGLWDVRILTQHWNIVETKQEKEQNNE